MSFSFKTATALGETVRIVGDQAVLGSWDPSQGLLLTTNANNYPIWSTPSAVSLPIGVVIQYKYVYIAQDSTRWEALECNRKFSLDNKVSTIEDEENTPISRMIITQSEVPSFLSHSYETSGFRINESLKFTGEEPLLIVSFNLPIKVTRNPEGSSGSKWVFERLSGL